MLSRARQRAGVQLRLRRGAPAVRAGAVPGVARGAGGLGHRAPPSWSSRCSIPPSRWSGWAPGDADYPRLHGLYWLCANLARDRPLLLSVDDAHWADDPSLRFLHFLTSRLEDLPVLLLVGTRPSEEALSDLLPMLASGPAARSLAPAPLSRRRGGRVGPLGPGRRGRGRVLPRLPRRDQRQPAADERADPRGGLRADGAHGQRGRARGGAGPAGRLARGAPAPGPAARGRAGAGPRGGRAGRQRQRHAGRGAGRHLDRGGGDRGRRPARRRDPDRPRPAGLRAPDRARRGLRGHRAGGAQPACTPAPRGCCPSGAAPARRSPPSCSQTDPGGRASGRSRRCATPPAGRWRWATPRPR